MKEKINFLYCFDSNYNIQAFTSIISLLDAVDEEICIYIIHSESNLNESVPLDIKNHKKLQKIKTYQFNDFGYFFPNIKDVHITVATYYRLFIANYLPEELKNIVYVDPDVICCKNPINDIRSELEKLLNSDYTISARTEHKRGETRIEVMNSYFNAGVMFINLQKWRREDLQTKLIKNLQRYKNQIVQWDQDVLNSFFNGQYKELSYKFNYKAESNTIEKENVIFLHFIGSHKPWLTSGVFNVDANLYHKNYSKIYKNRYHITHKWKKRSIVDVFIAIFNLKILKLQMPITYIKEFLLSLFKN